MRTGKLNWGIIGTGMIAKRFAKGVAASASGRVLAVASRTAESAAVFGEEFDVERQHVGYEALLSDPEVDAVYISTPHPMHAEWAVKAAEAGKHVLVEKPIGLNWPEAMAIVDAAQRYDVFLMEAFMYRCHPQTQKIVELVRAGVIGEVRLIQAEFSYRTDAGDDSRFFANELGGGGILDVGCYPTSLARLIAGAALGKPFAEPLELKACGQLGHTGVDLWAVASVKFAGGIVAQFTTGLKLPGGSRARIVGSDGWLEVPEPWLPGSNSSPATLFIKRDYGTTVEEVIVEAERDIYTYEADTVAEHLTARQAPAMSWEDSLGNMQALDWWRREIGLVYEQEQPARYSFTVTRRPLAARPGTKMKYGKLEGLEKPVARLVMGADQNNTMPYTAILFDEYFACGGNCFDTSHGYGNPNGACERNLGGWVRNRGIRDQVVIIEKGGNPPNGTPEGITAELLAGLERLQMDSVDIYLMHRDNPEVPAGEIVDVLNEHQRAGRMTIFGVSNWSLPRLLAAQDYARRKKLDFFAAISDQFSLARMLESPWPEVLCLSCSDAEFRRWFEQTQTPLMPWSSQARRFFTDYAGRDQRDDPEMTRCWYSEENFRRRDRAIELAEKYHVEPINIALAYVLCQPFPTFPLIGPRRHREIWSCLKSLEIELTPEELHWLESG